MDNLQKEKSKIPVTGQRDEIAVERLLLDVENPRLSSGEGGNTQDELLKILWSEMAVIEVALSIAANGFFPEEPLLVIPSDAKEGRGRYVVVEGNRRFAAVRLLRDPGLRSKVKATDLPRISAAAREKLDKIPVSIYPDRKSLWTYCGFRHIHGVKPWDAYSKSKYIATVHEDCKVPLSEIAERIGDRHSTVKRLYRGYTVLQQAQEKASFDVEDRAKSKFYFSHLYTALDQPEFQKFLGISEDGTIKANPVPKGKLENLSELLRWLYGKKSQDVEPVVRTQNPDLNTLREVIGKASALAALRSGYSLERCLEIAIGDRRRFREALTRAKEEMQQAAGSVITGYKGEDDLYELNSDIHLLSTKIRKEMESKREES